MTDDVLFLSGAQVTRLPDVEAAIAFTALSPGAADPPAKITYPSRCDDGVAFAHVSRLTAGSGAVAKSGSVDPADAGPGRPAVHAVVTALGPETGRTWAGARVQEPGTRRSAAVVVDGPATAARHAGPIMDALASAQPPPLVVPGEALTGRAGGRTAPSGIVTGAGVGLGSQDAIAARAVVRVAQGESV
ncbi:hypothetical protein ACFUEN_32025 [Streptomyces griseorubiginosus]|uniref:hypothetical protein n=1 Tax=Streptomyces griseorubiginosus TaxID=67304 RepID=UPI00362F1D0A